MKKSISKILSIMLLFAACIAGFGVDSYAEEDDISVVYNTHVQNIGWMQEVSNGQISGTQGQSKRVEALSIKIENTTLSGDIYYRAHVQNIGWQTVKANGEVAGTSGQSKRIEALEIYLSGELEQNYNVLYRVHVQDIGWTQWTSNGGVCGTVGQSKRIEAIEVKLEKKSSTEISALNLKYETHIQGMGWAQYVSNGSISGTVGENKRIEAIKIELFNNGIRENISYRVHVQDIGWQNTVSDNQMAGTVGQSKRIEAIEVNLPADLSEIFDIYYRVHVSNYGWLGWAKNGETAGTIGQSKQVEAIQIQLVEKNGAAPGTTAYACINKPTVEYSAHVQNVGWQGAVKNGAVSGTVGQSKRVEALKMQLTGSNLSGNISYSAHVQNVGWQSNVSNGAIGGTVGQSKRVEAIKITLSGDVSKYFDVYYRTHIENYGWLDWAKNGQISGSVGLSLRVEAYEVVVLPKGAAAPGNTTVTYMDSSNLGDYRIEVNKQMNTVTIYAGKLPVKVFICSTGGYTPTGTFYTSDQYRWAALIHNVYGQYATRITGSILFHSVPYNSPNVRDLCTEEYNKLGTQASAGCVRLRVQDCKWIFDNCPAGTEVVIYNSSNPGPLGKPGFTMLPVNQTYDPTDPAI